MYVDLLHFHVIYLISSFLKVSVAIPCYLFYSWRVVFLRFILVFLSFLALVVWLSYFDIPRCIEAQSIVRLPPCQTNRIEELAPNAGR